MLIVETHATSHSGRVRRNNEDNYLLLNISDAKAWMSSQDPEEFFIESQRFKIDEDGIVLAVSDGTGSQTASQMAVETVSHKFLDEDPERTASSEDYGFSLIGSLYEATLYANYLIHQQRRSDPQFQGMTATFTGFGITPEAVDLIQIGDSRAYLIRNDNIYQITKDQSLVQQLIDMGRISYEDAKTHPLKNIILQALGAQSEIFPVSARLIPERNDILILCSDGLSNKVGGVDLQKIVLEHLDRLEMACAVLVKEANERGGEDNITVILAKITGSELPGPTGEEVRLELLNIGDIHDTEDDDLNETV